MLRTCESAMTWWKRGRIGRGLESLRVSEEDGFRIIKRDYGWLLVERDGKSYIHLTLRGNSKQRRQQIRAILRYINGESK